MNTRPNPFLTDPHLLALWRASLRLLERTMATGAVLVVLASAALPAPAAASSKHFRIPKPRPIHLPKPPHVRVPR